MNIYLYTIMLLFVSFHSFAMQEPESDCRSPLRPTTKEPDWGSSEKPLYLQGFYTPEKDNDNNDFTQEESRLSFPRFFLNSTTNLCPNLMYRPNNFLINSFFIDEPDALTSQLWKQKNDERFVSELWRAIQDTPDNVGHKHMADPVKAEYLFIKLRNCGFLTQDLVDAVFQNATQIYKNPFTDNDEWFSLSLVLKVLDYQLRVFESEGVSNMGEALALYIFNNSQKIICSHRDLRALLLRSCILFKRRVDVLFLLRQIFKGSSLGGLTQENIFRAYNIAAGEIKNPLFKDMNLARQIKSYYKENFRKSWSTIYP